MLILRHSSLVLFFIFSINISFAADHPRALIVEHAGDTYAAEKERHKEGYTGTYIYEGEFNGSPYWVQNGCIGEFVVKECRCYIYKQKNTWVLVPQPPGTSGKLYGRTDDWLANAYNDNKWPWEGKWSGSVKSITVNNDIDLNKAREEAKINSCPVGKKEIPIKKPEEKEAQGWFRGKISEITIKAKGLKFWVKVPPALYIEHRGDEYGGDMIREGKGGPLGDEPAGYPHAGDYTGTYVLEGKFDGSPYWVQNNCVGGGDACRCYIYKQRDLWVLVPQHPGADNNAWLANAYTDAEFPWRDTHKWRGDVDAVYFKTSIDKELEYKKRIAIDSCPGEWPPGYKDKNPPIPPTQVDYSGVSQTMDYSGISNAKKRLSDGTDATVSSRDNGEDVLAKIENKDPTELAVNADGSYTSSANSGIGNDKFDADEADKVGDKSGIKTIKVLGGTYTGQTDNGIPHGFGVFIKDVKKNKITQMQSDSKSYSNNRDPIKYIGRWLDGAPDGYGAEIRTNETWPANPTFYDIGNQGHDNFKFHLYMGGYIKGERFDGEIFQIPNELLDLFGFNYNGIPHGFDGREESLFYLCHLYCTNEKTRADNIEVYIHDKLESIRMRLKTHSNAFQHLGKYRGKFKNDRASGQGTVWYNDGSYYSGEFKEGAADGGGKKIWSNGDTYHGNFKRNRPHGNGTVEEQDGTIYNGTFVNGEANGKGIKRFPDNSSYQGEFKLGQAHGFGTFTDPNGRKLTGTWENGRIIKRK